MHVINKDAISLSLIYVVGFSQTSVLHVLGDMYPGSDILRDGRHVRVRSGRLGREGGDGRGRRCLSYTRVNSEIADSLLKYLFS